MLQRTSEVLTLLKILQKALEKWEITYLAYFLLSRITYFKRLKTCL